MTVSVRDRLEEGLARILEPAGEGARTYLTLYPAEARAAADAADLRAREGRSLGPLDGTIVSIKDLFDVAGEPTRAGSTLLADAPPAKNDAPAVTRLRNAGAVIVGKTNMSEFAFTGVGMNPHFGTPGNPVDRTRVPGGSSSGAAVAVADRTCAISIGSDTGGSTRIPASLCGLVGFKPTKRRIPTQGAFPLSPTLDSIGPIARSVAECALADATLSGQLKAELERRSPRDLRLGVVQGLPMEDMDDCVARRFEAAILCLGKAGASLSDVDVPLIEEMERVNEVATIATVEAFQIHRERLESDGFKIDPEVRERIEMGKKVSSDDFRRMVQRRSELALAMDSTLASFDAFVLPTTPIVAPRMSEMLRSEAFKKANRLLLRNTAIANFFDLCAISLPQPGREALPTGLMLFARAGDDRRLLAIAQEIESLFAR